MKNYKSKFLVVVLFVLLGVMITIQLKSVENSKATILQYQRVEDLTEQLKRLEKEREDLTEQVQKLKAQSSSETYLKALQELRQHAGVLSVSGQGVIVTIDDSNVATKPGDNPNLYLIHDDDLLKVINELRAAGAEALSINDQRLIGTSEIRCAGPTVSVNNVRSSPPYVIKAIGDSQSLDAALKMRGGVIETLKFWGIQVQVTKENKVTVPGYKGSFSFEYAHIVPEEGEKR